MIGSQQQGQRDEQTGGYRHAFLVQEINSSKRRLVFCAYSDQERNYWVNALSKGVTLADIYE